MRSLKFTAFHFIFNALKCEGLVSESIQQQLMTSQERDEVGSEINQEQNIPKGVNPHEALWQKHIYEDRTLRQHHYDIAETDPFYLMSLLLIIILLQLCQTAHISPVEVQNMYDSLYDKQCDICRKCYNP